MIGIAIDPSVCMLGMRPADESGQTDSGTRVSNDPLYKALCSELLAPSAIKDWMKSDVDGDSGRTAIISPEQIRAKRGVQLALAEADSEVMRFAVNREWKIAKQNFHTAKSRSYGSDSSADALTEDAKAKYLALDTEVRKLGMPKYARTTKALRNYAAAIMTYASKLSEVESDRIKRDAVIDLESRLMPKVDNLYMGVPGRMDALSRIQLKQPFDAHARLIELEKHLDGRSSHIDFDQETRIQSVARNPIFENILARTTDLPKDGAVFFTKNGAMARGQNGSTPIMIDVCRMSLGSGKEGSGLFRFIGQEAEIDGAVVIKLKLKNGMPIPLKGSDPANPKYAKEICELIGNTPEWMKVGMTFGEVMKRFTESRVQRTAEAETVVSA